MQRNAHAQNNYLSRDSTQSHWMPGDSWTRANHLVNSQKIKFFLASECWAFHPHYPPKSVQATLNPHKKWTKGRVFLKHRLFSINSDSQCWKKKKIPDCLMCLFPFFFSFFCSLLRGLFASHYTETHYREDGSAVTGAHNFTVRWHSSAFDIYGWVAVQRCSAVAL